MNTCSLHTALHAPPHAAPAQPPLHVLAQVLDALDLGVLLLDALGRLQLANRAAWSRHLGRSGDTPQRLLRLDADARVRPTAGRYGATWLAALRAAGAGRRELLTLTLGADPLPVAVLPLVMADADAATQVLVLCGRPLRAEPLALVLFGQSHGLTGAECALLGVVAQGATLQEAALQLGSGIATVRTHAARLRQKTQSRSVGEVLRKLASLPPLMPLVS